MGRKTETDFASSPEEGDVGEQIRGSKKDTSPERTCIVTRTQGALDGMIRFVVGPDETVVPDLKRKLPGRGVYVTATAKRVQEAMKKGAFARAFKAKVNVPADLAEMIDRLMERDALSALSLANKAGLVVAGYAKVESAIVNKHIAGLVHARDAGADGIRKMGQVLRRSLDADADRPQVILFDSAQLDLALGRSNVIHAALMNGAAAKGFLKRCQRLEIYRDETDISHGAEASA